MNLDNFNKFLIKMKEVIILMINSFQKIDIRILDFIDRYLQFPILDRIMFIITCMGNGGIVWILLSTYLIYNNNYRMEGYMVMSSMIFTSIVGEGLIKHLFKRSRPYIKINKRVLLISRPKTYSFPSGHAASSFAVAGIFILMNDDISIYITTLASLIAFSRVYLNVHYLTDVLTGIILGLLCSILVFNLFNALVY